jgi:hypothetical protein
MADSGKAVIVYSDYGVELTRDSAGRHFLTVLVGGIAQSEITVALTQEEEALVREFGNYFVEKLALDISRSPAAFRHRTAS